MVKTSTIVAMALFAMLTLSCSESSSSKNDPQKLLAEELIEKLNGCWQWAESTGGIAGRKETPATLGNNVRLCLYAHNKQYSLWKDDLLIDNGQFVIKWEYHPYFSDIGWLMRIVCNMDGAQDFMDVLQDIQLLELSAQGDTLTVIPPGADIYISKFKKIN